MLHRSIAAAQHAAPIIPQQLSCVKTFIFSFGAECLAIPENRRIVRTVRYETIYKTVQDCAAKVCPQAVGVRVSLLHKNASYYGSLKPAEKMENTRMLLARGLPKIELERTIYHELIHWLQYWQLDETPNHGKSFRKYCWFYSCLTGLKID